MSLFWTSAIIIPSAIFAAVIGFVFRMIVMLDNIFVPDDIIVIVFMLVHDIIFINDVMLMLDEMLVLNNFSVWPASVVFSVYRFAIIKIIIEGVDEIIVPVFIAASITTH
jgi:hypothetical protein